MGPLPRSREGQVQRGRGRHSGVGIVRGWVRFFTQTHFCGRLAVLLGSVVFLQPADGPSLPRQKWLYPRDRVSRARSCSYRSCCCRCSSLSFARLRSRASPVAFFASAAAFTATRARSTSGKSVCSRSSQRAISRSSAADAVSCCGAALCCSSEGESEASPP